MHEDNGGPAFPVSDPNWLEPKTVNESKRIAGGMTLRDYFAAKAMQAYIRKKGEADIEPSTFDALVASWSYETADAMLEARK